MNTDTPETDGATLRAIDIEGGGEFDAVHVQVSKRLERERDRYKVALVQILKDGNRPMSMRVSSPSIIASDALQSPENAKAKP